MKKLMSFAFFLSLMTGSAFGETTQSVISGREAIALIMNDRILPAAYRGDFATGGECSVIPRLEPDGSLKVSIRSSDETEVAAAVITPEVSVTWDLFRNYSLSRNSFTVGTGQDQKAVGFFRDLNDYRSLTITPPGTSVTCNY